MPKLLSGAEIVFKALEDHNVEYVFGYPGGAVLPIYDELKNHKSIKHTLKTNKHPQPASIKIQYPLKIVRHDDRSIPRRTRRRRIMAIHSPIGGMSVGTVDPSIMSIGI